MRTYKDMTGNEHSVTITLGVRRRLKEVLNVDLLAAATNQQRLSDLMTSIATDADFLIKALAIVESCSGRSETVPDLSVIMANLEAVFDATTIDNAATCLLEAIIDFFPESSPVRRPLLDLMEKAKTYRGKVVAEIEAAIQDKANHLDWDTAFSSLNESMSGSGESQPAVDFKEPAMQTN